MNTRENLIVVLVTAGSLAEAQSIATALVEERLAACVNIVGPIESVYRWGGKIQREQERLLLIKTRSSSFDRLAARVHELHSYDTPEVIAVPITTGSHAYLQWLRTSTSVD
jgi:periplasmic divalent cation tolerance protein